MLNKLHIFILLFFNHIYAQDIPIIKIYLKDAFTGKNISDAKVTLEGFEIPAITGKYNKKEKYYYFSEIPKGYNTVMSYHKKYNEKGFQNINGLPEILSFKLFNKSFVAYDFFESQYVQRGSNGEEVIKKYKDYYIEDPYKIEIKINNDFGYSEKKLWLQNVANELGNKIELVNPFYERALINKDKFMSNEGKGYPDLDSQGELILYDKKNMFIYFPFNSGLCSTDLNLNYKYSNKMSDIVFIFRKTDGTKFKRFNDPIISKLKSKGLMVSSIIMPKYGENTESRILSEKKYVLRDKLNASYNKKNKIDSSKIFFFTSDIISKKVKFKKSYPFTNDHLNDASPIQKFFLIDNNRIEIPRIFSFEKSYDLSEILTIPKQDQSIGLGILDMYEYYYKKVNHEEFEI